MSKAKELLNMIEGVESGVTTRDDLGEPTKTAIGLVKVNQNIESVFTKLLNDKDFLDLLHEKNIDKMERYIMAKYGMEKTQAHYVVDKLINDPSLIMKAINNDKRTSLRYKLLMR